MDLLKLIFLVVANVVSFCYTAKGISCCLHLLSAGRSCTKCRRHWQRSEEGEQERNRSQNVFVSQLLPWNSKLDWQSKSKNKHVGVEENR